MKEKIYEEWNRPEWIQVDMSYMEKVEEQLEYYKGFARVVEEEIENPSDDTIENIKEHLEELKEVL
jgi:archaellum component FlaC